MKLAKKLLRTLGATILIFGVATLGLLPSFLPSALVLPTVDVGDLPVASPPAGMTVSALPTGTYDTGGAFAYRGGSFGDTRHFSMAALLVRHPKGDLLIDAGAGKDVDAHFQLIPTMQRKLTAYQKATPAAAQLVAGNLPPSSLAGVIPTHAHWDHVSGYADFPGVPLFVTAAGKAYIDKGPEGTEVVRSFANANYKLYDFEGGPYLGFAKSHDVWGDGAIVIVPAPGHTPDSVIVFVNLPSGSRYALVGDLVFQMEGFDLPAEKPWMLRRIIGEDDTIVRRDLALLRAARQKYPQLRLVPAHDLGAFHAIPTFPASAN